MIVVTLYCSRIRDILVLIIFLQLTIRGKCLNYLKVTYIMVVEKILDVWKNWFLQGLYKIGI